MWFLAKHLGSLPIIGKLVLADQPSLAGIGGVPGEYARDDGLAVGMSGRAITPLRPSGKAEIAGRVVDVVSRGAFVDTGVAVRLVEVDGFVVTVEAIIGELPPELQDQAPDRDRPGSSQGGVG
jgi:membrane-bound serine protease (ClpP class)